MLAVRKTIFGGSFNSAVVPLLSVLFALFMSLVTFGQDKDGESWALRECWRYQTTELESLDAASDGSHLYIGERGGRVTAVGADDGKRVWTSEVGGELDSNLFVVDRELFLVTVSGESRYELRSLSLISGIAGRMVALPVTGRTRIYKVGQKILIVSDVGDLVAVEPKSAKVIWTKRLETAPKVIVTDENDLVAGFSNGRISFIDPADGRITHTVHMKFVPSALLLLGDHLIFGDDRGNITKLDKDKSTTVWSFKSGGKITGIYAVDGSELLVTSFDNFTYLISRETGHVVWKRRQPARVVDAAMVHARYAGVTPFGESSVHFFNPENGKALGQIVSPSSLEFVQPAQLISDSVVTFTTEGLVSTGIFGCKKNEKAEANTSAFK